jgi:hypothetical protein
MIVDKTTVYKLNNWVGKAPEDVFPDLMYGLVDDKVLEAEMEDFNVQRG